MDHTSLRREEHRVDQEQQSPWRITGRQVLWTVGIIVALVGAYIFLRFAYVREWKWTGLVKNATFHKRTLWDWLGLLIVPVVLAVGGYLFTRSENQRIQQSAEEQRALDREIADQRTQEDQVIAQERSETDRQIADQRRQDDMLQAYLDQMGQLLLDKDRPLRHSAARVRRRERSGLRRWYDRCANCSLLGLWRCCFPLLP